MSNENPEIVTGVQTEDQRCKTAFKNVSSYCLLGHKQSLYSDPLEHQKTSHRLPTYNNTE